MASEDFGICSDGDAIGRLFDVAGLDLVELGCGAGELARWLAGRGSRVRAVEPDPVQAAKNRAAGPVAGIAFTEAGAQDLPFADGSADGAIFGRSLHHVAPEHMDKAIDEALRVLRPASGFLLVIEPVMAGSYAELTRPFNDESTVHRLAIEALARRAAPRFAETRRIVYRELVSYAGFDDFLADKLGATYNDHRREEVDTAGVRARFEAGRTDGEYRFEYTSRIDYYRGLDARAAP